MQGEKLDLSTVLSPCMSRSHASKELTLQIAYLVLYAAGTPLTHPLTPVVRVDQHEW